MLSVVADKKQMEIREKWHGQQQLKEGSLQDQATRQQKA
jgi:hypothetical protein